MAQAPREARPQTVSEQIIRHGQLNACTPCGTGRMATLSRVQRLLCTETARLNRRVKECLAHVVAPALPRYGSASRPVWTLFRTVGNHEGNGTCVAEARQHG